MNARNRPSHAEESRKAKRVPLEFAVSVVERGFFPKLKCQAKGFAPSQTGMGLRTDQLLPLGTRLHIYTNPDPYTFAEPLRLRGSVVRSSHNAQPPHFTAGVELDARSKDLKSWQSFILKRLRNLEA